MHYVLVKTTTAHFLLLQPFSLALFSPVLLQHISFIEFVFFIVSVPLQFIPFPLLLALISSLLNFLRGFLWIFFVFFSLHALGAPVCLFI